MYFLIYSAYPIKGTEEYRKYAGAQIACWINTNDREVARTKSRRMVKQTNWKIDTLEEEHPLSRKMAEASQGLRYYEQALIDDEVIVICTSPRGHSPLPLCRSEFLQNVVIELGRRSLKSLRYSNPTLTFEVEDEAFEGTTMERLNIEARATLGSLTKIAIWEDGHSSLYFREFLHESRPAKGVELHANLAAMKVDLVAELIRATLSDFHSVKHVWQRQATQT
jgi:hypothetical protein